MQPWAILGRVLVILSISLSLKLMNTEIQLCWKTLYPAEFTVEMDEYSNTMDLRELQPPRMHVQPLDDHSPEDSLEANVIGDANPEYEVPVEYLDDGSPGDPMSPNESKMDDDDDDSELFSLINSHGEDSSPKGIKRPPVHTTQKQDEIKQPFKKRRTMHG